MFPWTLRFMAQHGHVLLLCRRSRLEKIALMLHWVFGVDNVQTASGVSLQDTVVFWPDAAESQDDVNVHHHKYTTQAKCCPFFKSYSTSGKCSWYNLPFCRKGAKKWCSRGVNLWGNYTNISEAPNIECCHIMLSPLLSSKKKLTTAQIQMTAHLCSDNKKTTLHDGGWKLLQENAKHIARETSCHEVSKVHELNLTPNIKSQKELMLQHQCENFAVLSLNINWICTLTGKAYQSCSLCA